MSDAGIQLRLNVCHLVCDWLCVCTDRFRYVCVGGRGMYMYTRLSVYLMFGIPYSYFTFTEPIYPIYFTVLYKPLSASLTLLLPPHPYTHTWVNNLWGASNQRQITWPSPILLLFSAQFPSKGPLHAPLFFFSSSSLSTSSPAPSEVPKLLALSSVTHLHALSIIIVCVSVYLHLTILQSPPPPSYTPFPATCQPDTWSPLTFWHLYITSEKPWVFTALSI